MFCKYIKNIEKAFGFFSLLVFLLTFDQKNELLSRNGYLCMSGLAPAGPSCRTHKSSDTEDKTEINNKHNGTKNTTEVAN